MQDMEGSGEVSGTIYQGFVNRIHILPLLELGYFSLPKYREEYVGFILFHSGWSSVQI